MTFDEKEKPLERKNGLEGTLVDLLERKTGKLQYSISKIENFLHINENCCVIVVNEIILGCTGGEGKGRNENEQEPTVRP